MCGGDCGDPVTHYGVCRECGGLVSSHHPFRRCDKCGTGTKCTLTEYQAIGVLLNRISELTDIARALQKHADTCVVMCSQYLATCHDPEWKLFREGQLRAWEEARSAIREYHRKAGVKRLPTVNGQVQG